MDLIQDYKKLKQSLNLNLDSMGVINITPNSFSDGGKLSSYSKFREKFFKLIQIFDYIDIGAESTAPFNEAIGAQLELERFEEYLFPLLAQSSDPQTTLSIDTYRPEVFYEVALVVNKFWPKTKLIFNDVSGQIDDDLLALFKEKLEFTYIFSHNLAPSRDLTSDHMNYLCSDSRLLDNFEHHFFEGIRRLPKKQKVWADPCFGFSKSYEQNHKLLQNLHLMKCFDDYEKLVIGLSRKSFLRIPKNLSPKKESDLLILEQVHTSILENILSSLKCPAVVRTHDLNPLYAALCSLRILK